jgi:Arc/MetJ-type ribon-helix-helix transcriptional regulator
METVIRSDVRDLAKSIVEKGIYKYQSEIVRDAVRQLAFRYSLKAGSLDEVREIVNKANKKLDESLSQAVMKMREEAT